MYNSEISDAFVIPITNKISGDYGINMHVVFFDAPIAPKNIPDSHSFCLLKSITRRKRMRENKDDLYFDEEFILNTGPLRIDLLIIKKNENANRAGICRYDQ